MLLRLSVLLGGSGLVALSIVVIQIASTSERAPRDRPGAQRRTSEARAPCADHSPQRRAFFGDLHVHTALSLDAHARGTRAMPADAYAFARGQAIGLQPYRDGKATRTIQLQRPLDFTAVTDHAEQFGELTICQSPDAPGYGSPICVIYRRWPLLAFYLIGSRTNNAVEPRRYNFCGENAEHCREAAHSPWRTIRAAAEEAYDRTSACRFTTFVAYEYTASPNSNNLHRNVIFRSGRVPDLPISYVEAPDPNDMLRLLARVCPGGEGECEAISIPHNPNLSGGLMFKTTDRQGRAMTAEQAAFRARMEPLIEIMQHKGSSECFFGPDSEDELCDFEQLTYRNFRDAYLDIENPPTPNSFVRSALKEGLRLGRDLGANPFKYGIVAGTDTHLASPGMVDERAHPGHGGGGGSPANVRVPPGLPDVVQYNPGGLTVLWAEENSRDALFAAMRRREAYGTSGPRIETRFFGGWGYASDLCDRADFVEQAYAGGTPMGGDLPDAATPDAAPTFVAWAKKDAGTAERPGTPLQRLQIIKGWLDGDTTHERVFDVAGDPNNGASVDEATCEARGAGFDTLCTVWSDADFDSGQPAFYYLRVVENPTCRWTTWTCNAAGVDCADPSTIGDGLDGCCDSRSSRTIQERAWTSPIWFEP